MNGCSPSAPARAALGGDLPALEAAITEADRQGSIDASGLEQLADAVLRRELVSLTGPVEQFPDVLPCARHVRSVLEDVASGDGEFAAPAAVALIDAGFSAPTPDASPTARDAVEARRALGTAAGGRRRAFMLSGDAGVRRAALSAARESADRSDISALAEAARLDPDLGARALAVRALARIGGEDVVMALGDLYAAAPPEVRREIVYAWSVPATFEAGGQQALQDLAVTGSDESAVLAALSLYGRSGEDSAIAEHALVRSIESGAAGGRLLALEVGPWESERVRAALEAARSSSDPATRVVALLRRVEASAADAKDMAELDKLATDTATAVGAVARAALARAGQARVKTALLADLEAKKAEHRMLAALALLSLEDWGGAARALADDSPAVRRALACRVLAERGTPRSGAASWQARRPEALLPPSTSALPPPGGGSEDFEVVPLLVAAPPG